MKRNKNDPWWRNIPPKIEGVQNRTRLHRSIVQRVFYFMRPMIRILFFAALFLLPILSPSQDKEFYRLHDKYKYHHDRIANTYASSQSDSVFNVVGRWAWGYCLAIAVQGNYAYLGNGETFQVLDITDPTKPQMLGEVITDGVIEDIKMKGEYALVCCWSGLKIIDISNPSSPTIIYCTPPELGEAFRVEVLDTIALLCDGPAVTSIDIKDITHPYILSNFPLYADYISVMGHYAYAALHMSGGVTIIDISDPASLSYVGYINIYPSGGVRELKVIGNFLYVCTEYPDNLQIYDLATPENPVMINNLFCFDLGKISYDSNNIYISAVTDSSGMYIHIYDKSDPSHPQLVGKVDTKAWDLDPSDGFLYIATSNAFQVADIQHVDSTKLLYSYPTAGEPFKIRIQDKYAYIATFFNGMWILDVSNPVSPQPVANLDLGEYSTNIMVDGNYAYVINSCYAPLHGLWIINIADPYNPEVLSYHVGIIRGGCSVPGPSIAKWGNILFLAQPGSAQDDSTLEILDVSNPSMPVTLSVFHCTYEPRDIVARDSILYLATKYGGLRLINYSNPSAPYEVSSIFNAAFRLALDGNYLYVAESESTSILDISTPNAPVIVGSVPMPGYEKNDDMVVSGKFFYCIYKGDLYVFDITDPHKAVLQDIFDVHSSYEHYESSVAVNNDLIIMSDLARGVWFLQNKLDTTHLPHFQASKGWNLLSVPTESMDKKRFIDDIIIASGITSPAYTYRGSGYVATDSIADDVGFWMKFDYSQNGRFLGSPLPIARIDIHRGWNIIGSLKDPLPTSLIRTQPVGIIISNYFGYDDQYKKTDTIFPAKGYWVKASQAGELNLSFEPFIISNSEEKSSKYFEHTIFESLNRLELRDPEGHGQMLYFGSGIGENTIRKFELPPPAPFGSFDVRFNSGSMLEAIEPGDSIEHTINLTSAKYPVTLNWNIKYSNVRYIISINGKEFALSANGTVQISGSSPHIKIKAQVSQSMPNHFSLEQNYPNPFNGNTIIRYSVPQLNIMPTEKQIVSIKVYNEIGQVVAILVNEEKMPGNYFITWDPIDHPTGIYYYRLEAEGITIVKSMVYIK